jgi:hypothetical protein
MGLSVEILKTDANVALTFTEVAPNHSSAAAKAKTVHLARRAYDYIKSRRLTLPVSDADADELDSKLAIVKQRLEALGEQF